MNEDTSGEVTPHKPFGERAERDGDGDYELSEPSVRPGPDDGAGAGEGKAVDAGGGDEGDYVLSEPSPGRGVGHEGHAVGALPEVAPTADVPPAPEAVAERPKPLHDPDPYSTPPYGEPGPWAPAPPVQHPAAASAQQTAAAEPRFPHPAPPAAPGHQPQGMGTPAPAVADVSAPQSPAAPTAPGHSFGAGAAVADGVGVGAPQGPAPVVSGPPPVQGGADGVSPSGAVGPLGDAPGLPPAVEAVGAGDSSADPWRRYDPWSATPLAGAVLSGAALQQTGAAVPSQEQRRSRKRRVLVGGAVALALLAGGVGGVVGAYIERNGGIGSVELPQAGPEPAGRAPDSVAGIAARALPSVVTLHVRGSREQGTGTGFVLDARGHILTNNHVVEPAGEHGEITVVFNGGETAKAEVVGRDSGYDLAVVRVTGVKGMKPLPLGNSDNVQVGDPVVAIGAPFDLEGTVTSGIISAKERPITAGGGTGDATDVSYVDALQTDAPINPGNSGGPLLDSSARVIGINSAIRSADDGSKMDGGQSGSIGLGFAIPINQGKRVAEELINTGEATHPVIGVTLDMDYAGDGARINTKGQDGGPAVNVGGPGDRAGLRAGDLITRVDGQRVHSGEELIVKTRAHRPGDRLELTVERDGKERTVSLVLGSAGS